MNRKRTTKTVSTQDLNAHCDKYKKIDPKGLDYNVRVYSGSAYLFSEWNKDFNRLLRNTPTGSRQQTKKGVIPAGLVKYDLGG